MKAYVLVLVVAMLTSAGGASGAVKDLNWNDSTRDVFIDGRIDRTVQILTSTSPRRLALLHGELENAAVLDLTGKDLFSTSKVSFQRGADGSAATTPDTLPLQKIGEYARIDNTTFLFSFGGKSVLIRTHTGVTGEMTLDALWEAVPVWKSMAQGYQPNQEAIAALKKIAVETWVTVVLGTWCPDSKRYVPRLLRALELAGNEKLKLKLYGVDNRFMEPLAWVQSRAIVNAPLFIVERDGRELGRIIETPAAASVEEDLAAILNRKPNVHQGRWERGTEIARGSYSCEGAGHTGREQFTLFKGRESGYFLHSNLTRGDLKLDVYQDVDAGLRPSFVQVTAEQGVAYSRTRININGSTLTGRLKGNTVGVLEQSLNVPDRIFVVPHTVAGQAFVEIDWSQSSQRQRIGGYGFPPANNSALGSLMEFSFEIQKPATVRTRAGAFRARLLVRTSDRSVSRIWLHPDLPIPVKLETDGGMKCRLDSLAINK